MLISCELFLHNLKFSATQSPVKLSTLRGKSREPGVSGLCSYGCLRLTEAIADPFKYCVVCVILILNTIPHNLT